MDITHRQHDDNVTLVDIVGRIDLFSAPEARRTLNDLINAGHTRLVINLAETSFIDSSGLGILISVLKAVRRVHGDLRIAAPNTQAQTVLELTTLDRVLRPYATVEKALASYQ